MKRVLKSLFIFSISVVVVYGSFLASEYYPKNPNESKKPSIIKARYIHTDEKIIRVEIEVLDDTKKDFHDVIEVKFNNHQIPLLKADASGRRARKYYQLKPGTYEIEWKVSKSKTAWPKSKTYEKKIRLREKDKFVYILIEGENISISPS
ncbi:MAG: hypothetical protein K1060chlam1_00022 [Candidatus Anoxychlamydiales bacterium]|nr:hypothetical protein [Candidatus Anoxychlamydiales bacterium]